MTKTETYSQPMPKRDAKALASWWNLHSHSHCYRARRCAPDVRSAYGIPLRREVWEVIRWPVRGFEDEAQK